MDDIGGFFRTVPPAIWLTPIVLGVLYVGLTAVILRRAAARRRRERQAAAPLQMPDKAKRANLPLGDFLRGQLPDRPLEPAKWTVPAALRNLPEPDLDLLTSPIVIEDEGSDAADDSAQAETADVTPAGENEHDWVAAVVPEQEEVSAMTSNHVEYDSPAGPEDVPIGDAVEVLSVWRDLSDGRLIIQMGNQRYRTLGEIPSADLARRFVAIVRELSAMVNNTAARSTGAQTAPGESAAAVPPPDTPTGSMRTRMGLLTADQELPKPHMLRQVTRTMAGQKPVVPPPEPPPGIADSVEDFLQFRLSSTPQFATRSIHIRPTHDQGVRIEVDGHYYDAIDDVVDPDVREFLFAMMREWEARH
jgi:hypothetical protein